MSETQKEGALQAPRPTELKVESTGAPDIKPDVKPDIKPDSVDVKPKESVKPPKSKGYSNPALKAMGIPTLRLPSRNWSIFWLVVSVGAGGIIYDKYQQSQIRKKWMKRVEHLGQEPLGPDKLARKITVYVAPPPSDYLDESLAVFRRFVKPILNSAGIDYNIQSENRQGVIRSIVAADIRALRRELLETQEELKKLEESKKWYNRVKAWVSRSSNINEGKEKELTTKQKKYEFDYSTLLGVYYENSHKGDAVINEDAEIIDPSANGGVICIGRGAFKEYLTGLHEGLLGPLDKPIENNEFEVAKSPKEVEKAEHQINLPVVKDLNDFSKETENITQGEKANKDANTEQEDNANDDKLKEEEAKKNDDDGDEVDENGEKQLPIPKPFINPEDYSAAKFPSELDFTSKIRTKDLTSPVFQQSIMVIPVYHLLGFLNTPQRIYRFYTRRHLSEDYGKATVALVENLRSPFKLEDVDLAKDEEGDWPKKWVEKGIEKNSEWIQELKTDERVLSKLTVFDADKVVDKID